MTVLRLLLVVFVVVVDGKTVRYSNVPPRSAITTKTYDLEVPGSAPIRIIEAEPIWSTDEVPSTTSSYLDGLEHRSTKYKTAKEYFTTQPTKTTINEPVTEQPNLTGYSADALNTFLQGYADKVKVDRKKYDEADSAEGSSESNRPKSWGLVGTKVHNHPFEDKKGWVTLEAVPWSSSKISKWQSGQKYGPKPWDSNNYNYRPELESDNSNDHKYHQFTNNVQHNNINSPDIHFNQDTNGNKHSFHNPSNSFVGYNDKNTYETPEQHFPNTNKFTNSNKNVYTHTPNEQYNPNDNIFYDKPYATYDVHIRPSTPFANEPETSTAAQKPMYGYDLRPLQVKPDWPQEIPSRPSWNKPTPTIFSNKPLPDPWFDRRPNAPDEHRDIITDGRPGDFPNKPAPKPYPMYDRPGNLVHPATHPENGNGEWVLVSTTKGYQYPRSKYQRSIEVTPESVGTRRGIRLTVLPPEGDSTVNMTTSHGGLLEVESTFQSVEEAHKLFSETLKTGNKTRVKIGKKPVRQTVLKNPKRPGKRVPVVHKQQDATAVLAAVGAGMVPATMAMLVPFVTGRKRRSTGSELLNTVANKRNDLINTVAWNITRNSVIQDYRM
ncbi:hypothetical protein CBL_01056 [Carabus blaptoides fortunei]